MKNGLRALTVGVVVALAVRVMLGQTAAQTARPAEDLPVLGLAGITFKVSDLDKARGYYSGVLGFAEAFTIRDANGAVTSAFFKINDDQFVEVTPTLEPGELRRQARVMILSSDLEKLHAIYAGRGVNPTRIERGPDGNPFFRVKGPSDATIDFIQYVSGSQQSQARGKFLSPDRISTRLGHVGIYTEDRAAAASFYQDKLGFERGRELPGGRGDYIETPSSDRNIETKYPPLDPNNPATRAQYEREVMGAVQHMALEVDDMRATRDLVQRRGGYTDLQVRAHVGNNRRWQIHMFDPDGSRTEIMEATVQENLPPMTVMAPGTAVAPPILPKVPGQHPWP